MVRAPLDVVVAQVNVVTSVLDKFEASIAKPVDDKPDNDRDKNKSNDQTALVVDGEACLP